MDQSVVFTIVAILFYVFGNILIKLGINNAGFLSFPKGLIDLFKNEYFLFGGILSGIGTLFWIGALMKADLSYVYLVSGSSYILLLLLANLILKEPITFFKFIGASLIFLGVVLIGIK